MDEKEFRRMGRKQLIELIYAMKKREIELEDKLEEAERKLADRTIVHKKAGSIAEASIAVNNVFEAAQRAADDYLYSLEKARAESERVLESAKKEAEWIIADAERRAKSKLRSSEN